MTLLDMYLTIVGMGVILVLVIISFVINSDEN
jgi:hypothetical protein